jgi:PAS domain S-box-containing protein
MDSKESLVALFENATEGILIANSNGEIIKANPSSERLFGYQHNELLAQKIEILVPSRLQGSHVDHRERYVGNPHSRSMGKGMDLFGKRKDNSEFPVEISLSHYTSDGKTYAIAFIIDITERKKHEDALLKSKENLEKQVQDRTLILREAIEELEKKKEEIRKALEREMELNDLKSRFVTMASHEFRTPLTTILSSVAILAKYLDEDAEGKKQKHIQRIKSSVNNLTDILNDFLSIGKLEEGQVTSKPLCFEMVPFAEELVQELFPGTKPGQQILYNHQGASTVNIDNKLLKNILINLISNAIKFSPEGTAILLDSERTKDALIIHLTDHGIGIPEADQVHLFERFFRGQNAINVQGTGLGLNIVSKYCELMDGTISFTSKENEGTTFVLTFLQ